MNKRVVICFIVCLSMFQLSCTSQHAPKSHFVDYQQRIARVLGVDLALVPASEAVTVTELGVVVPRKRERHVPVPENTLSFFDFLRLDNCHIKQLVAERNNQLGKHMQAASGIVYELAVRRALADCIPTEASRELRSQLQAAFAFKRASVVPDFWQYSFGSDWYGRYAATSVQPLDWQDSDTLVASRQAFEHLNHVFLPVLKKSSATSYTASASARATQIMIDKAADKIKVNQSIQTLETGQGLGRLLVSMTLAMNELDKASRILAMADKKKLCTQQVNGDLKPNQQMDYLRNVVTTYFAQDIQVYLAHLDTQGSALLAEQSVLLDGFQLLVNDMNEAQGITQSTAGTSIYAIRAAKTQLDRITQYNAQVSAVPEKLKQSIRAHVQAVQRVMKICA